jgi:hypothetical protein
VRDDLVGLAAEENTRDTATTVARHHDQIAVEALGGIDDAIRGK